MPGSNICFPYSQKYILIYIQCAQNIQLAHSPMNKNYQIDTETGQLASVSHSIFDQCHQLLTQLFHYRLIEKLARPIDQPTRIQYLNEYKLKLNALNHKITVIQKEAEDPAPTISSRNGGKKNKSVLSTKSKTVDVKREVKKLSSFYNQILRQGSLKHYPKVAELYNLPVLNIITFDQMVQISPTAKKQKKCC